MHTFTFFIIKNAFRFFFIMMFRVKEYIFFTATAIILIKILKSFPMWFWSILQKLFLWRDISWHLLLTFTRFLCLLGKLWNIHIDVFVHIHIHIVCVCVCAFWLYHCCFYMIVMNLLLWHVVVCDYCCCLTTLFAHLLVIVIC